MLDLDSIYFDATNASLKLGKQIFYDSAVSGVCFLERDSKRFIEAKVGAGKKQQAISIFFDETGSVYEYKCDCGAADLKNNQPCPHIIATALAFEEKFPLIKKTESSKTKTLAQTDQIVFSLSENFARRRILKTNGPSTRKISLFPTLVLDIKEKPHIRFSIGRERGRRYIIKDISEFVNAIKQNKRVRFGQELNLYLEEDIFCALSKSLILIMKNRDFEKAEKQESQLFKAGFSSLPDVISASPQDVDELLGLFKGDAIEFEYRARKMGLRFVKENCDAYKVKLKIKEQDGGFYISADFDDGIIINGRMLKYLVTKTAIYPLSNSISEKLFPLLEAIKKKGSIFALKRDMPLLFSNAILPILDNVTLDAKGIDIKKLEVERLTAALTLFKKDENAIGCELVAKYGNRVVEISDEFSLYGDAKDFEAEKMLVGILREFFPLYPNLSLETDKEIYTFLKEGISALLPLAAIKFSEELKGLKVRRPPKISSKVRIKGNLLELDFFADEYSEKELEEMLNAYNSKEEFVRLNSGEFIDLTEDTISRIGEYFSISNSSFKPKLELPLSYAPFLQNEFNTGKIEGFDFLNEDETKSFLLQIADKDNNLFSPPASLKDILREYQVDGFRWLYALSSLNMGGILADEMGLGKSVQAISLILQQIENAKQNNKVYNKSIIVCPTSLILNWQNEFNKFAPSIKAVPIFGLSEHRDALIKAAEQDNEISVLITSYDILKRDIKRFSNFKFDSAFLDEAQYIKNPETKSARSVKTLSAKHKFALTGTPIENSLSELWSIFDFIMPGYLFSYEQFKYRFEDGILQGEEASVDMLKRLISPFILRRLKSQVLKELPPKIETDIFVPLEDEQRKAYTATLYELKNKISSTTGKAVNKITVLSYLMKLRQIACDPRLVFNQNANINSGKLDACLDLLKVCIESGHKVLIFSQFVSMLNILKERLAENEISHYMLTGGTSKYERMNMVNKFNIDDTKVFLISLKAGGTGLNLTGADTVMHYDPWWNEAATNQATDRTHRIGQNKLVQVYKFIMQDTVEEKIQALAKKKSQLSNLVLGNAALDKLKLEELLSLFD